MSGPLRNWAGNVTYHAARRHRPTSVEQLQRLVADEALVRAVGTGHSFNGLADTTGDLVSLTGLPPVIEPDTARGTARVSAGLTYSQIAPRLNQAGRALRNLASLPHISVAGAVATGTHGSGSATGSLATAVSALDLVTADGDLVTVSREHDPAAFPGMVVALGALGVVTRLTLETVPAFDISQYVYENLPNAAAAEHFDEIAGSAYSVSLFTDWRGRDVRQVWLKYKAGTAGRPGGPAVLAGARPADRPLHPVPGVPAEYTTEQLGVAGPWHERLPHFRPEFTPSSGAELQSEFLVPREHGADAFRALEQIRDAIAPPLLICEIRTVAGDDLWLSPCYERDSAAFHFTWAPDTGPAERATAAIAAALAPYGARPHWGKLLATDAAALARLYPRLADFRTLMSEFDPAGKFRNDMLDRYVPRGG